MYWDKNWKLLKMHRYRYPRFTWELPGTHLYNVKLSKNNNYSLVLGFISTSVVILFMLIWLLKINYSDMCANESYYRLYIH